MLVFYRSDRAKTIIAEGFQDQILIGDESSAAAGCLFSTDPFDDGIRGNGCIILFLDIPQAVFSQYAQLCGKHSRTLLIPAQVANQYGPAKLLTYKSAILLSRLIKAKRGFHSHGDPLNNLSSLTHNLLFDEEGTTANQIAAF
jgi:hypothetical protein